MRPSDLAKAMVAALAVLAALAPPGLAEDPDDGGAPAEELERACGWVDGPQALDPRALEEHEPTAGAECRAALRCLLEARRAAIGVAGSGGGAVAPAPADAGALCDEILALSPEDLRGFLEILAEAAAADPCARFFRCLLGSEEAGEEPEAAADAAPAGSWRDEFARLCGRTEDAAGLPREELEELIWESEALLERIEGLGIPEAKVYLFRLEKCRAFFEYALELEEARRGDGGAGGG